ncbi:class I SAM-dependent methyltransferase [Flavobacterium sp. N1994]|uniref:class I SAM-dependent methyltransferase n=1 Tax=Flavobacterium sp. N1994 TaxID=2986827 RepID=UPI002222F475|nr:class I SAM-dependent methyltransferase [Flavobacterium sp. N1994]
MTQYENCKVCESNIKVVNEKYNLGQCDSCKLIFCLTIFSQDEFVKVYDELYNKVNANYKYHSIVEYNMLLENKTIKVGFHRAKLLKKYVLNKKCQSVLEIGSGVGLIGSYIRQHDASVNYTGIEIDKEAFEKSQTLGLNTINNDFKAMDTIEETFDVIMLWEVLEHLQDLKSFLDLAHKKLNKGGKIILSVPNYNKIYNTPNREKDAIFQDLPPIHLNFFTKESIINVFELNHFKDCKASVKKFPYISLKKTNFYIEFIKALLNKYNGSTIHFVGSKSNN